MVTKHLKLPILLAAVLCLPIVRPLANARCVDVKDVQQLIEELKSQDDMVQGHAIQCIEGMRHDEKMSIRKDIEALVCHRDQNIRAASVMALSMTVRPIMQVDPWGNTRASSPVPGSPMPTHRPSQSWRRVPPETRELAMVIMDLLKDMSPLVRMAAARSLGQIGPAAEGWDQALIEALGDPDEQVRAFAALAFRRMASRSTKAVRGDHILSALIDQLEEENRRLRKKGRVRVQNQASESASQPLPVWLSKAKSLPVRAAIAKVLGMVHPERPDAVPLLMECLDDPDPAVRQASAQALTALKADTSKAAARLVEAMEDEDESVRRTAIRGMHRLGEPAIPKLEQVLLSGNVELAVSVTDILRKIGIPAVPALNKALDHDNTAIRLHATKALADLNLGRTPSVAILTNPAVSPRTRLHIWRMPAATILNNPTVPPLTRASKDTDEQIRLTAVKALDKACARAMHHHKEDIQHCNSPVPFGCFWGMERPKTLEDGVPALGEALSDRSVAVRKAAIKALSNVIEMAHDALPALEKACHDEDASVRDAAVKALSAIK